MNKKEVKESILKTLKEKGWNTENVGYTDLLNDVLDALEKVQKLAINYTRCCATFVRFNGIKTKCFNPSSKYKVLDDKDEHYLITDDENDVIWVFKQNFTIITE